MQKVYFDMDDEILNPCYDNVFKALFTKDTETSKKALMGLLSAIIGREVVDVAIKQNEPAGETDRERQIRFDINCKFNDGDLADVEMTLDPDANEAVRIEYYSCKLFVSQDIRGVDRTYGDLKHTYQITLTDKSMLKGDEFIHHFQYKDQNGELLQGRTHIYILELSKLKETVKKPVEQMTKQELWAVFFKYSTDKGKRNVVNEILRKEESIAMAGALLQTLSKDDHEQARMLSEYKYAVDLQSKMVGAKREGIKEGAEAKALEVAKEMLAEGLNIDLIGKVTKLPLENIKQLVVTVQKQK